MCRRSNSCRGSRSRGNTRSGVANSTRQEVSRCRRLPDHDRVGRNHRKCKLLAPRCAGGATRAEDLEAAGTRDPGWPIQLARRFLDAGACLIMIESEGITENVNSWRPDVPEEQLVPRISKPREHAIRGGQFNSPGGFSMPA